MRTFKKCGSSENIQGRWRNECFKEKPTGSTMVPERRRKKEKQKEKPGRALSGEIRIFGTFQCDKLQVT